MIKLDEIDQLNDFEHDARQLRNNLDAAASDQEKAVYVRAFRDKWTWVSEGA